MSVRIDSVHPLSGITTAEELGKLEGAWGDRPGLVGALATVDHKRVAARYVIATFGFFALAGLAALFMRLQLARPENNVLGPDAYNQAFTTHGTTMMFLFAVPVMEAMGLYLVPLMIGTRNIAFPRLNSLGFWTFLVGGLLIWTAFFLNTGPDAGWFAYVPLSGPEFTPGKRSDIWAQTITFTEIAALIAAIEIIVTAFKQRAPGMTLSRMPIFVWAQLVTAFMVFFAMSTVATASIMLALDRLVGTHFFNPAEGGDALLWQHLFWFFGHPEVYIIFVPATGMVSAMLPAFTRRPVFGHTVVVFSVIATGFLSFSLWVHHMFSTGVAHMGSSFFTSASLMVVIPTAIQIFCWIATIWTGRIVWRTPFLFILGFFFSFIMGGLTGVMVAAVPLDLQLHDSYFVVAHFHYVLIGGAVFPLIGAIYYWFPKFTGRLLSETLGRLDFALFFIGTNLTFFPMHMLGLMGMPRRVYTYLVEMGWGELNLLATVGAFVLAAAVVLLVLNVVLSLRGGEVAGDDPWDADSLEWATTSPPPPYNFARLPVVEDRAPNWHRGEAAPYVVGLSSDKRDVLVTSAIEAEPHHTHEQPYPTLVPLLTAVGVGVFFITSIFTPWGAVLGAAVLLPPLLRWGWPRPRPEEPA